MVVGAFPRFYQPQANRKSTPEQPQTNHNTDIDIEKEQQRTQRTTLAAAASSTGKALNKLDQLPSQEREAVITLYHQRTKTHPITNPSMDYQMHRRKLAFGKQTNLP
jgi:hypothetical protein